ncbi:bifunctional glycosyltransferase/CDP-glycerol:glycerophosphate glycerophosphotransferase [Microbulbifer celer]|uniref:CDP-glycerol glycerophosphotransferase family protein n=1 Tax=Microbulbifer celer TaxID=435905 RepID=A0ABW3UDX9_9GAMM|nr:CDP-glycerol glycerophosphotransferase family protein [Microbulbifer celer]UFN58983.1 CDP-glycerol glycerophosphotransferase family protein [Microbulbifer celer]
MKKNDFVVSVVVPVYNVQGQVRKCLNSIVAQSYKNLEIIIVDDCSTDNSAAICHEVAKKNGDVTFKVITHKQNKGLGAARNTGIDAASGSYILFVDSDDWIESDLIQRSLLNAQKHSSDVVIFNHKRVWPSGYTRMNWRTDLFESYSDKQLTNTDRIEIFKNLNVAWNKLYRLDFIRREGIAFGEGYYEDIPWTYFILSLKAKITLENYCGYYYYQRPGSILNSSTDKHFEIFERYAELFSRQVESEGSILNEECRRECFFRFVEHIVNMSFERVDRLPQHLRTTFALQAREEIIRHANALRYDLSDFDFSRDPRLRWRYPVLMRGSSGFLWLFKKVRPLVRKAVSTKTRVTSWVKKQESRIKKFLYPKLYQYVFIRLPIKTNVAVFSAYWDSQIACNPKAISDELMQLRPDIEQYWIVKNGAEIVPGYQVISPNSLKYYYTMAVAKYFINNANFPNFLIKRQGQIHIQTKHGTPIKKMGYDLIRESKANDMSPKLFAHRCARWDYVISSNTYSSEIWRGAFPFNYQLLEIGYPRNDRLKNSSFEECIAVRESLGIPSDAFVILYMPTFRDYDRNHVPSLEVDSLLCAAGENSYLIVRSHYFKKKVQELRTDLKDRVLTADKYPIVEDLYIASDILVSDYSSSVFDYMNLGRQVFLYCYDFIEYQEYRGIYLNLQEEFGEFYCETQEELESKINQFKSANNVGNLELESLIKKYTSMDDGNSSRNLIERIF